MPKIKGEIRTTMFSVEEIQNKEKELVKTVVTHHLPWEKDNPKIHKMLEKGYTFQRPSEVMSSNSPTGQGTKAEGGINPLLCAECGFNARSEFGLTVHQRKHKKA